MDYINNKYILYSTGVIIGSTAAFVIFKNEYKEINKWLNQPVTNKDLLFILSGCLIGSVSITKLLN